VLTDDQVFMQVPNTLRIVGANGEGEFTNFRNTFDVNDDTIVNPLDILVVINDLVEHGSRPLNMLTIATTGVRPEGYLDTNVDGVVNPLDLLGIINHMTAKFSLGVGAAGEAPAGIPLVDGGEGEGESAASLAMSASAETVNLDALVYALTLETSEAPVEDDTVPADEPWTATRNAVQTDRSAAVSRKEDEELADPSSSAGKFDSEAADELFARLGEIRGGLRSGRLARTP
ncbi:MAG: dockerin type I domain-containing protein, partial [Pirellulaceae bacterium]